ncbi:MAG: oligosaccharide flippase family protein [Actinomycetota bacterium]|nr:oligosaccharide flippase family protein [Actinomycetota bacterium]
MTDSVPHSPAVGSSGALPGPDAVLGAAATRSSRFAFSGSLRARAARGTLINGAFSVGIGLLNLLKAFILAAFLSRSDYGVWGIIVVSLSTLVWLKQAGVGDKFIQQDEGDQELAFQQAFTLELILTLGCVALIGAALPLLVLIYGLPQLVLPSVVIALALIVSVFQAPQWIYLRRMQFARQRALAAVDPVVGFVVSVGLAILGAGYWAFVGGMLAGVCAASAAAWQSSPYRVRWRYDRRALRGYWSFSLPLVAASGAGFVISWSAVLAAKLELGVAAVGVIALADNIASLTERVDDLLTGALYPAICAVRDRRDLMYESLVKSNRLALIWAVPFGIAITLFCGDLVRFGIGERWRPAVIVMQVYGAAAAVNHIGFNWTAYFRALGRTRPIAVAAVAASATFLVAGIPLLVAFGLEGFAFGIALQGLAALILRAGYLQRLFPGFGFIRHAARSFLPTIPAAAAVLAVRALEPTPRTLGYALGELSLYLIITALSTWALESALLREALAHLRRPAVATVS